MLVNMGRTVRVWSEIVLTLDFTQWKKSPFVRKGELRSNTEVNCLKGKKSSPS